MAVLFVNAAVQPVINQEVLVATVAGPLDNLDAYVQANAWADGFLSFFVYATVGGVRGKVASAIYQGPKAGRLQWEVGTNPPAAPVHAGGTSYDLVVFAQATQNAGFGLTPSAPPAVAATFAGVNESDVVADSNTSATVAVAGGEATITTAAGFNQAADVAAVMTAMPALDFRLYASCGAGSVEALIAEQTTQGADGITSVMRDVVLPVATLYRLACAQANPGSAAANVTASLSTYQNVSGAGGGGGGGGVAPGLPGQVFQTEAGPATAWGAAPTVPLEFFGPTGTANDSVTLQAAIDATSSGALYRQGLTVLITKPATFATPVDVKPFARLQFGPGTWNVTQEFNVRGECEIAGAGPGQTIFVAAIPFTGIPTQAPFVGQTGTAPLGTTTVNVNNAVGSAVVQFATNAGGNLTPNNWLTIADNVSGSGFQGGLYRIVSVAGAGPFNVTLDRPVLYQFGAGDVVTVMPFVVQNAVLRDMTIRGTCQRYIEFAGTYNCTIENVEMIADVGFSGDIMASFDVLGYQNQFVRCVAWGQGIASNCFALETQDSSVVDSCLAYRAAGTGGYQLLDCASSSVVESHSYDGTIGISISADGNAIGSVDCRIDRCVTEGHSNAGISIASGSRGTLISNSHSRYNASNLLIGATDRTRVVDCRLDHGTTVGIALGAAGHCAIESVDVSDCGTGINLSNAATYVDVDGLTCVGTTTTNCVYIAAGQAAIRGADISTTNAISVVQADGGTLTISDSKIVSTAGAAIGVFQNGAGIVTVRDTTISVNAGAGQCMRAGSGTVKASNVVALAGSIGIVLTGGIFGFDEACDFSACATFYAMTAGKLDGAFVTRDAAVAAGGGTSIKDLTVPTGAHMHVNAYVLMRGVTAVIDAAGLFADAGYTNTGGVLAFPATLAGSANPNNSGGLIGSSGAEYCSAGFISGGGAPSTAVWSINATSARLTVTNQSGTAVAGVAQIYVDFHIAA